MTLVISSKATYTAVSPDITAPCGLSTLSPPLSLSPKLQLVAATEGLVVLGELSQPFSR